MKKQVFLLIPALLYAVISFAQKFDISEQAGYNFPPKGNHTKHEGLSNQVALGCRLARHFSISAFWEYEKRSGAATNAFGISPDIIFNHAFIGLEIKEVSVASATPKFNSNTGVIDYATSFGIGIHVGARQQIVKHLYLVEQIGETRESLRPKKDPSSHVSYYYYPYARLGLSYRF